MNEIISVKDISKSFHGTKVLDKVSFSIRDGEIFGLLGPNGAGKSTLTKIILGLVKEDSGSIKFNLNGNLDEQEKKSLISLVPQEESFFKDFTVKQNILFFASLYGINSNDESIKGLIEWLNLKKFEDKKAIHLSGGYRKLLNIACSLVNNPRIIFMDEPTVGLDPSIRRELWGIILGLNESGKTIVLTTHYMREAEELCDRTAVINEGKVLVVDAPKKLIKSYGGVKVFVFTLSSKPSPALISSIKALIPNSSIKAIQNKLIISVSEEEALVDIAKLSRIIGGAGFNVQEFTLKEPGMEEVFLHLVEKAGMKHELTEDSIE
ncbi:MAG: ABC transporter ATP-binding protein [archaeon]|nr:ABC transporter ATP-binding protein [Candidatus Micrarchaeota archaeon]